MTADLTPSLPADDAHRRSKSDASGLRWLDLVLVAVVTFAVFAPLLKSQFSPLDDYMMIVRNERMHTLDSAGLMAHWTAPVFRIYMPIPLTVWNFLAAMSREDAPTAGMEIISRAWPFKLVSVAAHAMAAAAAAWALAGIVRARWPAILGGLLVGLHPFQVESVGWTTGMKDVLCGLFAFLAIGHYARFVHANNRPTQNRNWWTAFVFVVLACASKPTAMTLPAAFLAIDIAVRGVRFDVARRIEALGLLSLPPFLIAMIMLSAQADPMVPDVRPLMRPLIVGDTLAMYLAKLFVPYPLLLDYGRRPTVIIEQGVVWYAWLLPAAVLGAMLWRRSALLLLAGALFVIPIAPVSGLVDFDMQQYSTVADHYMYQPMLGAGLALALLVRYSPRKGAVGAAAVLLIVAVISGAYARLWADQWALNQHTFKHNPKSHMAASNIGFIAIGRGDQFSAEKWSKRALDLKPDSEGALTNMAQLAAMRGQYRLAAVYLEKALPAQLSAVSTARRLLQLAAILKDPELAERAVKRWVQLEPDNPRAQWMLVAIQRDAAAKRAATQRSAASAPAATTQPARP